MRIQIYSFCFQMSLQKSTRALEKKEEQLNASRRILEEQEDELLVSHII